MFVTVMLLLTETQVDRIVCNRRALALGGLLLMVLALGLPNGLGFGGLTGFMLLSLASYGLTFRKWRTDPGLWMLAVLITVLLGPGWAYLEFLQLRGLLVKPAANLAGRPLTWEKMRVWLDASVAMVLFAITVRFAVTVAFENWKRSKRSNHTMES